MSKFTVQDYFIECFWVLIGVLYLLWPVKAVESYSMAGFYLTFIFCLLMVIGKKLPQSFISMSPVSRSPDQISKHILWLLMGLSFLGLFFHLYDKIIIRGYDYFSCIDIREVWLAEGRVREGRVSSWQSAVGHALVYFWLIPAIYFRPSRGRECVLFFLGQLGFIVYAWTIVSRSTLLSFSLIVFLATIDLKQKRLVSIKDLFIKFGILAIFLAVFICGSFIKKFKCLNESRQPVFMDSTFQEHGIGVEQRARKQPLVYHFKQEYSVLESPFQNLKQSIELPSRFFEGRKTGSYLLNVVLLYTIVGINNFSSITQVEFTPDRRFVFDAILSPLQRLNLFMGSQGSKLRSTFGRGYINLPGAIALTFDRTWFYITAVALGLLLFLIDVIDINLNSIYLAPLKAFCILNILLAPLVTGLMLMSTPFILSVGILFATIPLFTSLMRLIKK